MAPSMLFGLLTDIAFQMLRGNYKAVLHADFKRETNVQNSVDGLLLLSSMEAF